MKFHQRLAYYLLGFLIGCIGLYYIFQGRHQEFNYMPNARVLSNLRKKELVISAEAQKQIAAKIIDTACVSRTLRLGDVDFDKSNVTAEGGKLYVIEGQNAQKQPVFLEFINLDSSVVLRRVYR